LLREDTHRSNLRLTICFLFLHKFIWHGNIFSKNPLGWALPAFCWTSRNTDKWSRYSCSIEVSHARTWPYQTLLILFIYLCFLKWFHLSSITGNFGFQLCSHGDFLGAILGTGIARNKLGDIILLVSSLCCFRLHVICRSVIWIWNSCCMLF
jgi:hypothetical protein